MNLATDKLQISLHARSQIRLLLLTQQAADYRYWIHELTLHLVRLKLSLVFQRLLEDLPFPPSLDFSRATV